MIRNYLVLAFRNLARNSFYSFINIGGLAIGLACSILIMLWVWDEISYDRFHKNSERLGQLYIHNRFSDNISTSEAVPLGPYEFLKTFDARIKNTCVAYWPNNPLLTAGENKVRQFGRLASKEFLEMFQFPLVKGEASKVLDDPKSIVITESLSKSLFGDKDPMGQFVKLDNDLELKVTGVLKDLPFNSTFDFKFLASWAIYGEGWAKGRKDDWQDESFPLFVELQPGATFEGVNEALKDLVNAKRKGDNSTLFILPLSDWRLHSTFKNGIQTGGMGEWVNSFSIIATFILMIACINFMNLATARSQHRAREVGVRKTVGSGRKHLIMQFLGESLIIATLAFVVAVLLVELSLPLYNHLIGKHLSIPYTSPAVWLLALLIVVVTGTLAGSYPAFFLSAFNPVNVLKGNIIAGRGATTPRKVLVALQFFFSICLIFGTLVVYRQIQFVKERATGYDKENLVVIQGNDELARNFDAVKHELVTSGVAAAVTTSSSPITDINGNNTLDWPGKPIDFSILFSRVQTGYDYIRTMGIKMAEGRDFSEEFKSDSSAMLLNEAAVNVMGVQNPLGLEVNLWGRKWHVIGVTRDVVMSSPFREVQPGFFMLNTADQSIITLRLPKTNDANASIKKMENVFKKMNPSYPFEYAFVDEQFAKKFEAINFIGTLGSVFSFLAIFITCLGLFGLATFTASQRTKEIGIRKVMGATRYSIVRLLSAEFTRLVLIGFLFAAPLAWWAMDNYLTRYTYRTTIAWWTLPLTGLIALGLTVAIVSSQALRAASANPVQNLRSE
jgi:ABC-type antimicrobial peptide transport system permease subunit